MALIDQAAGTEILEVNELLANTYEPKRQYQWIIALDGLDAFTCKTFVRPGIDIESIEINFMNSKRFLAGKATWQTMDLILHDPIAPSATQKVMEWIRLHSEETTGRQGYSAFYKKDFRLKMLDPVGAVVEEWEIKGAKIDAVRFGDLDYATSDATEITLTIQPDRCTLLF